MSNSASRSGQQLASLIQQQGISNTKVLQAIANTPRQSFVEPALAHKAFENTALPIGKGQTISQPVVVAHMTELLLEQGQAQSVLEIGTGSGYQTAILAQLYDHVYTVERIKSLQFQARRRLQQIDLHNVSMKHGDGWKGWKSKAPYSAIIVTAAAASVPEELLNQLSDGGILVIPVGEDQQMLKLIKKQGDSFSSTDIANVKFVPLVPGDLD
ncbi:protein-L-isoaspartate(D-aspartate) O-methyltransferase [Catenovulum sp. SM1970]|uniref:protein-L-isoaspartate(D-aspartate) O-methyltransferase n=1 Tax=Marinifaba aquimaris TaxID=2741323 RepID=UPI001574247D|nr:protein-L-isoaspartate(D-aspartate) O-methyltransferase [Marinifaba aquimaris]NTS78057.1 protein-L-isoaspartate(D-aspartate) O-methyltransferase [Marinifaba aquimaris]